MPQYRTASSVIAGLVGIAALVLGLVGQMEIKEAAMFLFLGIAVVIR